MGQSTVNPGAVSEASVLSRAVVRAASHLGLSNRELAAVLGLSPATISRMGGGRYTLRKAGKEWELGLLLVRLFRSLVSIVGSDDTARQWLRSANQALNGRPAELIAGAEGLVRVVRYLDAARSPV